MTSFLAVHHRNFLHFAFFRLSININYDITSETRENHQNHLTELYLHMRDCMGSMLAERERCAEQREEMIGLLLKYIFGGDLEKGAILLGECIIGVDGVVQGVGGCFLFLPC